MKRGFIILALVAACGGESPTAEGYAVLQDDACHQLLLEQCQCCGNGEPNCTPGINDAVNNKALMANLETPQCEERLAIAKSDADAFCASFKTNDALTLACYGFPPTKEEDASP